MAADYGYNTHRDYVGKEKSRMGPRFQTWETTTTPPQLGWGSTPTIITKTTQHQDHVCRPIIVDPDGNTRPGVVIVPYQNKTEEGIVSNIETVVERVYPSSTTYTHEWGKPAGYWEDQPSEINEFITNIQTSGHGYGKTGFSNGGLFKPQTLSNPWSETSGGSYDMDTNTNRWGGGNTNETGTVGWGKPSRGIYDNRWGTPMSTGGNTNETGTVGWGRPSGNNNNTRHPIYDVSYGKEEPHTADRWGRPSKRVGWAAPPSYESNITKPTSNIGGAVEYVRESARPASAMAAPWQGRFSAPYPMKESGAETIDSMEAKRRYSAESPVSSASTTTDPSAPIIDSREAARKYKGQFV